MKRFLFTISLVCCLSSVFTNTAKATDDEGKTQKIRLFLNSGETLDFDAALVDSITATTKVQTIWYEDTCFSYDIETIDSIWYMTPTLRS